MRLRPLALALLLLCPACSSGSASTSDKKASCDKIQAAVESLSQTTVDDPKTYVQNYGAAARQLRAVADKSADKTIQTTATGIANALDDYLKLVPANGTPANSQDSMIATTKLADATSALNTTCGSFFQ
jgi:hypothetical protein